VKRRIVAVSLNFEHGARETLSDHGVETIEGDLLDPGFTRALPDGELIIYLAGKKFGTGDDPSITWALNTHLPAVAAQRYAGSRIVAFSTGCVYPLVPVTGGGSLESDPPDPVGEYSQSCLGRERILQYFCLKDGTPTLLLRLNYAVEMRYGVLLDIALKVKAGIPVDLTMGHVNVIWGGDVNSAALAALQLCDVPAQILNVTGPEQLTVRWIAEEFGARLGVQPKFTGREAESALLNNAERACRLYGLPSLPVTTLIDWTADWVIHSRTVWDKPTHFQVRDGRY